MAGAGMDHETGGLVDHDHVVVDVDHRNGHRGVGQLLECRWAETAERTVDAETLALVDPAAAGTDRRPPPDPDPAGADQLGGQATGSAR